MYSTDAVNVDDIDRVPYVMTDDERKERELAYAYVYTQEEDDVEQNRYEAERELAYQEYLARREQITEEEEILGEEVGENRAVAWYRARTGLVNASLWAENCTRPTRT